VFLNEIAAQLDAFFRLDRFEPDSPFSGLVPGVYAGAGIAFENYLEPTFLETCHGLMVRNGQAVNRIRTIVFLSEEILDTVLDRGERDVLLITHHPLVMETGGRGFLPLPERYFFRMQERAISVYALHTPLDVHDTVSTGRALARELGIEGLNAFYRVSGGYAGVRCAGVHGRLPTPLLFDDLLEKVTSVTGVSDPHFIRHHQAVQTVGVIPGGTGVPGILEACDLGNDVLVTGTYYNLVQTGIGQRYRDEFEAIREELKISLVECSHYASEAVVMRTDVIALCAERFGIDCEFIPQADPWY
jgi:putative NIF3 family GTP cyclohydrolase 1 type 2